MIIKEEKCICIILSSLVYTNYRKPFLKLISLGFLVFSTFKGLKHHLVVPLFSNHVTAVSLLKKFNLGYTYLFCNFNLVSIAT